MRDPVLFRSMPVTRFTAMFSITLFGQECDLQIYSIAQCLVPKHGGHAPVRRS